VKYVDSNVFIYPVLMKDEHSARCAKLLQGIALGEIKAMTSVLTWDELVYVVSRTLGHDVAVRQGEMFLRFPGLTFHPVDMKVLAKAQELVNTCHVKPRDAIHAATAILCGAEEIVSDDDDFDRINTIRRASV
jgi:uncharacterized protein